MTRTRSIALAAAVAIVAIGAGMLLSRSLQNHIGAGAVALASGTLLDPPRPLPAAQLVDQDGAAFGADRLRGQWSLLFFGFTSCPDVCPTTLATLAQTYRQLADLPAAQRPQVVLVSVDAQRDTPQRLAAYVKYFSPDFLGVTAPSQPAIEEFARQMGVVVAITQLPDGNYTVDHSAAIFLVDPQGSLRALFSPPHSAALLAADYRRIATSAGS
jgi:protein SCO1